MTIPFTKKFVDKIISTTINNEIVWRADKDNLGAAYTSAIPAHDLCLHLYKPHDVAILEVYTMNSPDFRVEISNCDDLLRVVRLILDPRGNVVTRNMRRWLAS